MWGIAMTKGEGLLTSTVAVLGTMAALVGVGEGPPNSDMVDPAGRF